MAVVGNEVATLVQVNVAVQLGLVCRRLLFQQSLNCEAGGQGRVMCSL